MPIYDFPDENATEISSQERVTSSTFSASSAQERGRWLSGILARLFFVFLLILDLLWGMYACIMLVVSLLGMFVTWKRVSFFSDRQRRAWKSVKRAFICAFALIVAVCSPPFGIMVACTYFLMYDRNAVEEIVPASLQDQFHEFFHG